MAGITRFQDNPEFQRIIQKIMSLTPDQRAIFDTSAVTESFATSAIQNRISGLRDESDLSFQGEALGLRERRLGFELSQIPSLRRIGIGQVVASSLFGLTDLLASQKKVRLLREQALQTRESTTTSQELISAIRQQLEG